MNEAKTALLKLSVSRNLDASITNESCHIYNNMALRLKHLIQEELTLDSTSDRRALAKQAIKELRDDLDSCVMNIAAHGPEFIRNQ
jgi:hypothetical protein